jgi:CAAX prenyl protease-like protein
MTDNSIIQPSSEKTTAAFILPLIAFLVIASFYPDFSEWSDSADYLDATDGVDGVDAAASTLEQQSATWKYLFLVGVQVLVAGGLLTYFRKIYTQHFPLKISLLSVIVGVVGVVLWIGICEMHLERSFFNSIGLTSLASVRPAFNPFESITDEPLRNLFLVLRFVLLALLVPIVEELFLRGWLVRWVHDVNWESVSLQRVSWGALLAPSIYGALTHPSEAIAAILWFGLVTWLMQRTGNLWDCVMAHAVTNALLGIYVVQFSAWHLW